jgi:hypothetical protein
LDENGWELGSVSLEPSGTKQVHSVRKSYRSEAFHHPLKADAKIHAIQVKIKAIKIGVTRGDFEGVSELKKLKSDLKDARQEKIKRVALVSTLKRSIKRIRTAVKHNHFSEAGQLPILSHELAEAEAVSAVEERPQGKASVFSSEADKRTLALLKLMLEVKKLSDEVAAKDEVIAQKQSKYARKLAYSVLIPV